MTNSRKPATYILGAVLVFALVFVAAFALLPTKAPTAQAEPIVTFGKVTSEDQITAENIGECTFEDMKAWVGSHWDGIFDGVDEYTNVLFVYAVESGYKGSSFCKANFASGEDFATSNRVGSGTISSIDQVKESYQLDGDVVYLCGFEVAAAAAPSAIKLTGVPDEWTEANDKYWDEGNFVEPYHEYFYSSFTQDELPGFIPCTKEEANEWSAPTEEFTVLIFALNDGVCSYRIINSGKKDGICEDALRRVDIFSWFNNGRNIYYTGEAVIEYPLYVGDTQVTDGNMDDVFGDGTVRFTPADEITPATLTLNGVTVSTYSGEAIETYGIYWNDTAALNIVLTADTVNTVSPSGAVYGIYSNGAITISGEGTLTAAGTESSGATGLYAKGLTIDGSTVDISGAYGIKCTGYTVTISSGVVTAKGDFGAVRGNVINAIPGTGWTDVEGTEGMAAVAVSTEGQTLDYKKVTFVAHTHDYSAEWSSDDSTHWHACQNEDCNEPKADEAAHIYGEDLSEVSYYTCSVCGYVDNERKAAVPLDPVTYLDETGAEQTCTAYTVMDADTTDLTDGWYVVSSNVTSVDRISVHGDVKLIICDGKTLTNNYYVNCWYYDTDSLTVYVQSTGENMGSLVVDNSANDPSFTAIDVTNLTINGGNILAKGNNGIEATELRINGGDVTAIALSEYSQGIRTYNANINGGKVVATGQFGINGPITISDGDVYAEGTVYGFFIAGGGGAKKAKPQGDISINGGNVTAVGGEQAIFGTLKNAIAGTGWTDVEGTEGMTAVAVSTEGQTLDYKKVTFVAHTHDYSAEWNSDDSTHWHACQNEDCNEPKADEAAHTFGDDYNQASYYTCSVCGYISNARKAEADRKVADDVAALIDDIGTVEYTVESKAKIDKAMAAFGNLTEEQKALVGNKAELPTAETTYNELGDQAKAQVVVAKIAAIGEVKYPDSKDAIREARIAYDALTPEQKAYVDNYGVLTAAEAAYAALEAAAHAPAENDGFDIGWIAFIFGMLVLAYFAAVVVLTKVYRKDGKRLSFIGLMASAAVIIAAIVILAVNPSVVSAISFLLCAIDALLFIFFGIGYGRDDDEKDEVIR